MTSSSTTTFARSAASADRTSMSSSTFSRIARRPRAPVSRFSALRRSARSDVLAELELDAFHLEELVVLLASARSSARSGCGPAPLRRARRASRRPAGGRRTPGSGRTGSGRPARRRGAGRCRAGAAFLLAHFGLEADAALVGCAFDDLLETDERAAADEQDVAPCRSGCTPAAGACGRPAAAPRRSCPRASSAAPAARLRRRRRA